VKTIKNNELYLQHTKQLRKIHSGKKPFSQKIKLSTYKSYAHLKTHYLLKKRKIKLHRLKFVSDIKLENISKIITEIDCQDTQILPQKYVLRKNPYNDWKNEKEIIDWLESVGIVVKRASFSRFLIKNRIFSLNSLLIFANKKRLELGLSPFYLEGVTED
jgi:hypothetical protein